MLGEQEANRIEDAIYDSDEQTVIELLRSHPAATSYETSMGTWLYTASGRRNTAVVQCLIDLGCDPNQQLTKSFRGNVPLDAAIRECDVDTANVLLKAGADPNHHKLLLSAASANVKALALVKMMVDYGADIHKEYINDFTNEPMNALSMAIAHDKQDVVDYLRSKGAKLPTDGKAAEPVEPANEIVAFCEGAFGPVDDKSLIEIVPTDPAITIHCVPPGDGRNHITLFTSGMSSLPMTVPAGAEEFQYAELFIQLPPDWKYMEIDSPEWGWPIHWLRSNAQYAHQNQTWLGGPVCLVANDDPPEPLAPNTEMSTLLLLVTPHEFTTKDGKRIRFYQMSPLHTAERQLEIDHGVPALLNALDKAGVSMVVDINRPSAE